MHRRSTASGALAAMLFAAAFPADAAVVQTSVTGSFGAAENACTQIVPIFTLTGCTYGNDRVAAGGWIGPTGFGGHYAIGSAGDSVAHVPVGGDGKIAPALSGAVAIDDGGTPGDGSDDLVSAQLAIGATARNVSTGQAKQAVERWSSMTHTMAAHAVDSATANAQGGFDYVIGLHGFPGLICSAADATDCFASENAPVGIPLAPSFWAGYEPNGIGIERNASQGGNTGATTTAAFQDYSCSEIVGTGDCASSQVLWGAGEDPGFDNLLLRIVTNGAGTVVSASGYWTQEWRLSISEALPGDNSWVGGTLSFGATAVPLPAGGWLLVPAFASLARFRRRRAGRP